MQKTKTDKKREQWKDYKKKRNIIKASKKRFPNRDNMSVEFPKSRKVKKSKK